MGQHNTLMLSKNGLMLYYSTAQDDLNDTSAGKFSQWEDSEQYT